MRKKTPFKRRSLAFANCSQSKHFVQADEPVCKPRQMFSEFHNGRDVSLLDV